MTDLNTTATFSGHNNQGFLLGSNSGHVHVNFDGQEQWLDKLSHATQAAFDSFERQHDLKCLHNTRVELLKEIRAWADRKDERRIYWLNGMAGTGKSTIARSVAHDYFEHGCLGASFFFSKGGGDVGNARKFFTTIAFQLAQKSPILKKYICDAVSKNIDIKDKSLRDQWHQLILQPLSKLDGECSSSPSSYILVVDALDECEGESDIRAILQLLAEARSLKTVQLRVFLTSRREIAVRHGFYQISNAEHEDFILHNISPSIVGNDIGVFFEYNFNLIGQARSLGAGWPGEQRIKRLIQKASGLFIWAASACRFVREGKQFAAERLDIILKDDINSTTAPEQHLDQIYVTILKQSIDSNFLDEEKKSLYSILRKSLGSIVVLFSPLSADSLCKLLHITKNDIDQTLENLHAILDIPKDQTKPLLLHHPSFRDFLISKKRCEDLNFRIDEKQAHQKLADNSISLMATFLKQDICSLGTYGVFVTDINSSRVQQCLPQEVQYACLYWVQHLAKSCDRLYVGDQVHQFLQVHVLHWLEALSWMRKFTEGIHAIASLESIALTSGCPDFYAYIHDIKRFTLYNRPAIDQAPLQVYCSALVFAPTQSMVRKQFKNRMPGWIKISTEIEKDWNATLQTLEGHSSIVNAVAFSPDGKVLASASHDKMVNLWDAGTGAALQTLEGHRHFVTAIAFSPDGKVLASASEDRTVKLWDAGTGAALQTLKSLSIGVAAVAFSPDGKVLASASRGSTVKLWNAGKGVASQTLEGHLTKVTAVAFSPDGKMLASASGDYTVKLWDAGTGAALRTLKSQLYGVTAVAFSPEGKALASASCDRKIKLWDLGTGAVLQTLKGHLSFVSAIAFSPDGKVLASASNDHTVKLWNAVTGMALQTLKGHFSRVTAVAFSPEGKVLASTSHDQTVKLWDAGPGEELQTLKCHSSRVRVVAFSPNGRFLVSISYDRTLKLWDANTGALRGTYDFCENIPQSSLVSVDGSFVDLVMQCCGWPLYQELGYIANHRYGNLHDGSSIHKVPPAQNPSQRIHVDQQWVKRGMENLIWLPSEYRPECTAVHGSIIALGHASGRVSILEFTF